MDCVCVCVCVCVPACTHMLSSPQVFFPVFLNDRVFHRTCVCVCFLPFLLGIFFAPVSLCHSTFYRRVCVCVCVCARVCVAYPVLILAALCHLPLVLLKTQLVLKTLRLTPQAPFVSSPGETVSFHSPLRAQCTPVALFIHITQRHVFILPMMAGSGRVCYIIHIYLYTYMQTCHLSVKFTFLNSK